MTDYDLLWTQRLARRTNQQYTTIGERRFKQIDWGKQALPQCQMHDCAGVGEYDAPTVMGPWADICIDCVPKFVPEVCTIGYHRVRKEDDDQLIG